VVYALINEERDRQIRSLELIASENFTSRAVMECLGSALTNKNTVHGDTSALTPGGVRIGTPAMTTRGLTATDFTKVGEFLDRCCTIALEVQKVKGKKLKDFEEGLINNSDIIALRSEVEAFASCFGYPGI